MTEDLPEVTPPLQDPKEIVVAESEGNIPIMERAEYVPWHLFNGT